MVQPGRSSLAARWRVRNADFTEWPSFASLPFTASTNDTGAGGPDDSPVPPAPPVTADPHAETSSKSGRTEALAMSRCRSRRFIEHPGVLFIDRRTPQHGHRAP